MADIEGRIAELFAARLSPLKQVITLDDVEAMTAKMGRVSDFQTAAEAEDDEDLLAGAVANGSAEGAYTGSAGSSRSTTTPPPTDGATPDDEAGTKRLYRDMANRKIAGVAAGIARYFAVNPLWIRLGFLALLLLKPLIRGIFDFGDGFDVRGFNLGNFAVLAYIVLWIVLPKRYDATPADEDPAFKKLYRDTDAGKVGGVSAGLAAYFRVDVVLIRILFLVGLFAGGFTLLLYIALWVLLPEAKTASDKLRMRGSAVTLSALDSNLRGAAYTDEAGNPVAPATNRPVGVFLENSFQNVRPLVNLLGAAIRIFAGGLLVLIGFSLLLAFVIMLGVGLGMIPESDNIVMGAMPAYTFFNGMSPLAVLCFFLLAAVPALALLLAGLGLLVRRSIMSRTVSLSLLGLWLLGIVGSSIAGVRMAREFQREAEITETVNLTPLTSSRLVLERRYQNVGQWVNLDIVAVDSGQTPRLERVISARGATEEAARQLASTSIEHGIRTPNDSTLSIDDHYTFRPGTRYRDQEVRLRLLLPRNRTFRMSESFANWLRDEDYLNGRAPYHPEQHAYRLRGNRLECLGCTDADLHGGNNDEDRNNNEDRTDYDEGRDDADINLDFGQIEAFDTNENGYGSGRRNFSDNDFDHVSVVGPYRVVIRPGSSYSVRAAGSDDALRQLIVEREGDELVIKPRNRSLFGLSRGNSDPVLVTVELPVLNHLELVGGARAQVSGFRTGDLRIEQAGAAQLALDGKFDELNMELAGGCRANLRGSAEQLQIDGAGACEVAAPGFTARRANIDVVGASKVHLRVTEELKAEATGASLIEYSGNPTDISRSAIGASTIRAVRD